MALKLNPDGTITSDATPSIGSSGKIETTDRAVDKILNSPTKLVEPVVPVQSEVVTTPPPVNQAASQKTTEPQIINKASLQENIQSTFDKFGGSAGANQEFIQGVARFGTGADATEEQLLNLEGKPLSEVISSFNIGGALKGFGITEPTVEPTVTDDGKPDAPTITEPAPPTRSVFDDIRQIRGGLTDLGTRTGETAGVTTASQGLETAALDVQDIRNRIIEQTNINEDVLTDLEGQGRGITSGLISAQQADLSVDQQRALRDLKQDYNNALIVQSIKQGTFDRAERIAREIATDVRNDVNDEIDLMLAENAIEEDQAQLLRDEADIEFARQADGFIRITQEEAQLVPQDRLIQAGGKFYIKPAEKTGLEIELEGLDLLSKKLGIESQLLKNELIGDDKFQATTTTADGIFRVTYDKNGNEINRSRIGDSPAGTKPVTLVQSNSVAFGKRVEQAEAIIDELAKVGTGFAQALGAVHLPELFKSENRKRFEQAERNLINAQLRRESGAAIAESEFKEARLQYIPQPGDGDSVLKQKAETRRIILEGFKISAGNAWTGSNAAGGGGVTNTEDLFN